MVEFAKRFGYLFYIVDIKESSFKTVDSVPDYITQVIPHFLFLIIIEQIIAFCKGFPLIRVNDAIASLSQGMFMEMTKYIIVYLLPIFVIILCEM